jgi:hypothetical protein
MYSQNGVWLAFFFVLYQSVLGAFSCGFLLVIAFIRILSFF